MSKPRVHGRTIGVRLPLMVDAEVRRLADVKGVAVSVLVRDVLTKLYGPDLGRKVAVQEVQAPRVAAPSPKVDPTPEIGCKHKERVMLGGGMARCTDCGAVRGTGGLWR